MGDAFTEAQGVLFAEMDARAREGVEKKFRVRLDSAQSTENQQAAWEVYQNATVKLIKTIGSGVTFGVFAWTGTSGRSCCSV
jgi:2-oxo-4-hydroxy-4-carboxy--5-ureidoimidazoline (OHCU) decarboxylase